MLTIYAARFLPFWFRLFDVCSWENISWEVAERKKRKRQVLEVALRNYQFRHLNLVQNVLFRELKIVTSVRAEGVISPSIIACLRMFPKITKISF